MNKDKLGNELRKLMDEEAKDIEISPELMKKILIGRKRTWREKIDEFLNKEIEVPLLPVIASLALAIVIISIPEDFILRENIKVVNIGSSQIIFREDKRVSKND